MNLDPLASAGFVLPNLNGGVGTAAATPASPGGAFAAMLALASSTASMSLEGTALPGEGLVGAFNAKLAKQLQASAPTAASDTAETASLPGDWLAGLLGGQMPVQMPQSTAGNILAVNGAIGVDVLAGTAQTDTLWETASQGAAPTAEGAATTEDMADLSPLLALTSAIPAAAPVSTTIGATSVGVINSDGAASQISAPTPVPASVPPAASQTPTPIATAQASGLDTAAQAADAPTPTAAAPRTTPEARTSDSAAAAPPPEAARQLAAGSNDQQTSSQLTAPQAGANAISTARPAPAARNSMSSSQAARSDDAKSMTDGEASASAKTTAANSNAITGAANRPTAPVTNDLFASLMNGGTPAIAPLHNGSGTSAAMPTVESDTTRAQASLHVIDPDHLGEQVGALVSRTVKPGRTEMVVRLDPPELGRIDVRLDVSADGRVRAVIAADNPATMDMMRRDSLGLERALQDAGLKTDSGALSFNLRGDDSNARQQQATPWQGADRNSGNTPAEPEDTTAAASSSTAAPTRTTRPDAVLDVLA